MTVAFFVLMTVLTVLVFGAVIRRLLGVRVGFVRTGLAAAFALLVVGPLVGQMLPDPEHASTEEALVSLGLAVAYASVLAMIALVLAEAIVPDGSLPGPIELWRSWRARAARGRRYAQVLRIAVRHGLGRFLRGRRPGGLDSPAARRQLARSLRQALDEGGVTFVKLGQQLSTRRDLVSAEFAEELAGLQDQAAPVPWETVAEVITSELGRPVDQVFAFVDPVPLAAASVAQVHAARLPDGTDVVVKVQRPRVADVVERDLDILARLARTLESRTYWGEALGLRALAVGFAEALREELDFTVERDNMRSVASALGGSAVDVRVPLPYPELTARRVLVMQRMAGTPLGNAEPILAGLGPERRRQAANALLDTVLDQVLVHGVFHVDLHPGNVLVDDDGTLALLDLGSVGRLGSGARSAVGRLLAALERGDSVAGADALLELVDRPDQIDERGLERAVGVLLARFASAPGGTGGGAAAFPALFRLVTEHRLGVPPDVAAVFRALATLEGTLLAIEPEFDLVARARESGRARYDNAVRPENLRRAAEDELLSMLPVLRRLPRRIDRVTDALEHGRLSLGIRLFAHPDDRRVVTELLHQVLLTVLGAAAGVMAVLLLGQPETGPAVTESIGLFTLLGYSLLVVAVVLALRVLVVVFRREPV